MDESEKLKKENQRLKSENQKLKEILRRLGYILNEDDIVFNGDQRLSLYCDYFKGREDVFAKRYFNQKKQIYQYSFECRNRFKNSCPLKHGGKCSIECYYYDPVPLNEVTIYNHLHTKDYFIALYPLKEDNTCYLLAIDFDKKNWFENMLTVYKTANKYSLPCIMERSQSGNGGHLWFFFETNIKAKKARKLGDFLLKEALKVNKNMSFESFDRMFPNQDYLAKAGLGNCIALPLQYDKKEQGCSVFINEFNKIIPKQFHQLYFTKKSPNNR